MKTTYDADDGERERDPGLDRVRAVPDVEHGAVLPAPRPHDDEDQVDEYQPGVQEQTSYRLAMRRCNRASGGGLLGRGRVGGLFALALAERRFAQQGPLGPEFGRWVGHLSRASRRH